MLTLRKYQVEAKQAVFRKLAEHRSTLIEMATGLGKTVVFAHIADEWPGRVLVIAHRDELIRQAADKIQTITCDRVAVEMGREYATDELFGTKVTVGSVQTLSRANRRTRFHPDHFSLVIVDEGHHAAAMTYREVLDYFASARKLFVTATPKRKDGVALSSVCESVAYQYGIEPAINDGWLVPVRQTVVKVEGLDFSRARTVAEDFNEADLEKILTEEEPLHRMVSSAFELIGTQQALWFCVTVAHAKATAAVLARYAGQSSVCFLSGDTPKDDRRAAVEAFKAGKIQHFVNCSLFLEGFDAPGTSVVVMGRPTKSLALYTQILGRGTRPLPGVVDGIDGAEERKQAISLSAKPGMTVIDYAGNAGRHKIIQATDVLGGKHEPKTREYAQKTLAEEGSAVDVNTALERAKAELALEQEEESLRARITAKAAYTTYDVNPFVKQYNGHTQQNGQPQERCSNKQAGFICHLARECGELGWTFGKAKELTPKQASGVIKRLKARVG